MEYNDNYSPLENNDYENDSEYNVADSSLNKIRPLNKGYHKIVRTIKIYDQIKTVTIGVYGSACQGSQIRNAETGEYYKYIVGSLNEDLFFKNMICTGEFQGGPLTLFYNSPEHYERHQHVEVDETSRKNWEIKKQNRLDFLKSSN